MGKDTVYSTKTKLIIIDISTVNIYTLNTRALTVVTETLLLNHILILT